MTAPHHNQNRPAQPPALPDDLPVIASPPHSPIYKKAVARTAANGTQSQYYVPAEHTFICIVKNKIRSYIR